MNRRNVESQLQGLVDGTLSAAERAALLSRIKSDPLLLETYCEYAQIESALRRITASEGALWAEPLGAIYGNGGHSKRWIVKVAALGAAAALILLAAVHYFIVPAMQGAVAYRLTPGSTCEVSHPVAGKGQQPEPGTLGIGTRVVLTQGTVELRFPSGIRAIVRAPADLTLNAKQQLDLDRGVAWFHVPPSAAGFRVQTPEMMLCNLGTEFGICARPNQADEIHVLKGKVEVHTRRESSTVETLSQGEARAVGSTGRMQMIGVEPDHFLTRLASTIPYLHWSFDGDPSTCIAADGSHPAAACSMSELVSQGDPSAFSSTPGRFGVAFHATGIFADAKTAWAGISGKVPRTIAHWLKLPRNQVGAQAIVGWGSHDLGPFNWNPAFLTYLRKTPLGTVAGVSFGAYFIDSATPIDDDEWHHFAVVYRGGTLPSGEPELTCYLDGRPESMVQFPIKDFFAISGNPKGGLSVDTKTSDPWSIPLTLFPRGWCGDQRMTNMNLAIDELYVFEAALAEKQIKSLYRYNRFDPE